MIRTVLIPALLYAMGNVYLREYPASTLKKCDDLGREIEKLLVANKLRGRTYTKASDTQKKAFGLRSADNKA